MELTPEEKQHYDELESTRVVITKAQAEFARNLDSTAEAFAYVTNRGISPETIATYGLGYAFDFNGLSKKLIEQGCKPVAVAVADRVPELCHLTDESCVIVIRHERMIELHFMVIEIIRHVLVDDFRISRYHRAIEMVRSRFVFHCFIIDGWIEYPLYAVLDEPLYMTVYHFCLVAGCIR